MDPKVLREIAGRFAESCCQRMRLESGDLKHLGVLPVPAFWECSIGRVSPLGGSHAMCLYVYEKFTGNRLGSGLEAHEQLDQICDLVAKSIRTRADQIEQEIIPT